MKTAWQNPLVINLTTARLELRNLKIEDISEDYVNWLNDPQVNKFLNCAGQVQTKDTCRDYVCSYDAAKNKALIGMFLNEKRLHIGNITLSAVNWPNKFVTLGICVGRKEYWGKGLASEALKSIIRCCFQNLRLHRVQALSNVNNPRSTNLFLNCGFKIEGRLRESNFVDGVFQDGFVLSLLSDEWKDDVAI